MSIKRTADGVRQRISKRSGAVIPVPESLLKARKAVRPPEPGPKDTPAAAVARVSYVPDPALLPYLAAGGKLWERAGAGEGKRAALPKLLRGNLRWRSRRKVRERFETGEERARLARAVDAMTREMQAAQAAAAAGAAAAAAPAAAAAATELR